MSSKGYRKELKEKCVRHDESDSSNSHCEDSESHHCKCKKGCRGPRGPRGACGPAVVFHQGNQRFFGPSKCEDRWSLS